jgi:hypothetical protein
MLPGGVASANISAMQAQNGILSNLELLLPAIPVPCAMKLE